MASDDLDKHVPYLKRVALRLTGCHGLADEAVQESLLRAVVRDDSLEPVRNVRAWLCKIVTNVCRERWRKDAASSVAESLDDTELQADFKARTPSEIISQREFVGQVWEFVHTLPNLEREVLLLNVIQQLTHGQIAERLNTTTGSVKVSLSSARSKLRARFPLDNEVERNHER